MQNILKYLKYINFKNSQSGLTLIEILVAMAITGVVSGAVVTTLYQLQSVSTSHYAHILGVNQVENGVHYLNRDVQSAQTIAPQGSQGFPLTLTWVSWDTNDTNTVTYSLVGDPPLTTYKLVRQLQVNQGVPAVSTVARFIVSYPLCNTMVATTAATPGMTVLKVANTSAFPPTASLVLPGEPLPITYSGKTPTSFTGIPGHGCGSITLPHAIGQSVTTFSSYFSYDYADHKLIVQLTSDVPAGSTRNEETRQLVIIPRPGS